jgi:hypothetical protein
MLEMGRGKESDLLSRVVAQRNLTQQAVRGPNIEPHTSAFGKLQILFEGLSCLGAVTRQPIGFAQKEGKPLTRYPGRRALHGDGLGQNLDGLVRLAAA